MQKIISVNNTPNIFYVYLNFISLYITAHLALRITL